jgi:catechol 2,3-dioxygenase-like lactoylglutathione lyase family enzyme
MLSFMIVVTMTAPDLAAVESAYSAFLKYRVADRGQVSEELASIWDTPRMVGRDYLLMQPESGAGVFLRFVQADPVAGYGPMKTFGWNATEILVQDPDALAEQLADSPFEIVGSPMNLSSNENIRAMQVVGPANEVLYFTRIPPGGGGTNLGSAQSFVDRTFIVVLGGPDMESLRSFYNEILAMPVSEPFGARVRLLSGAHGLDLEYRHPLAMASLPKDFGIELDEYPPSATTRAQRFGELPPGMAMVGFRIASLTPVEEFLISDPLPVAQAPYEGRRVGVLRGPAGELIELVEGN